MGSLSFKICLISFDGPANYLWVTWHVFPPKRGYISTELALNSEVRGWFERCFDVTQTVDRLIVYSKATGNIISKQGVSGSYHDK